MKLALHGATGRMGLAVARVAHAAPDLRIVGAVCSSVDPGQGKDIGELAGTGTLGVVALMTGHWILYPIICIIPTSETISVALQVLYFKLTKGRRLFRMSPLHFHFELSGWSETQIVQRFWLIALLAGMFGVALALV